MGCYLSHVDAWRYVASLKDDTLPVLVLEDDVAVPPQIARVLHDGWQRAVASAGRKPVFLLYNNTCFGSGCPVRADGLREVGPSWSLVAAALNGKTAKQLLASVFPIDVQIDFTLRQLAQRGNFKLLYWPALNVSEAVDSTDIQTHTVDRAPMGRPGALYSDVIPYA